METLLNRYRNLTVLLLVILAQLVLLAYQVKNNSDVRLIRVWAVTAVTPLARTLEGVRSGTVGFLQNYFVLRDTRRRNERLRTELGQLKLENQFLQDRALHRRPRQGAGRVPSSRRLEDDRRAHDRQRHRRFRRSCSSTADRQRASRRAWRWSRPTASWAKCWRRIPPPRRCCWSPIRPSPPASSRRRIMCTES